tara:strand:- start:88 stop:285 length:198 start_codon:yes stop_codon:yes gene_type:complete
MKPNLGDIGDENSGVPRLLKEQGRRQQAEELSNTWLKKAALLTACFFKSEPQSDAEVINCHKSFH